MVELLRKIKNQQANHMHAMNETNTTEIGQKFIMDIKCTRINKAKNCVPLAHPGSRQG